MRHAPFCQQLSLVFVYEGLLPVQVSGHSLFGKVEGVDNHRIDIFHLAIGFTGLRIIRSEDNMVKHVIVDHEQLAIGILPRQPDNDKGLCPSRRSRAKRMNR